MSLLARNTHHGLNVNLDGVRDNPIRVTPRQCNPLSKEFVVPEWLKNQPTPWRLVEYLEGCLRQTYSGGVRRSLSLGIKANLRPAKALLQRVDGDGVMAARVIKYTADKTSYSLSFHRVLDRIEEVCGKMKST